MDFVSSEKITAIKGDLIEFRRYILGLFWAYCHFVVYTESAVSGEIIPEKIGDRYELLANICCWTSFHHGIFFFFFFYCLHFGRITVGVDTPWWGLRWPFWVTKLVEKTTQTLCNRGGRVNNLDKAAEERGLVALKPDVIVARAREFLRNNYVMCYNVLFKNCEHFATLCRYEKAFSLQVRHCWIFAPFNFISMLCSPFYNFFYPLPRVDDTSVIMNAVRENEKKKVEKKKINRPTIEVLQ
jgi:hypothetical protein